MSKMEEKSSDFPAGDDNIQDKIPPRWVVEIAQRHSSVYCGAWDRGWIFFGNYSSGGENDPPLTPTKEVVCKACPRPVAIADHSEHKHGDAAPQHRDEAVANRNVLCTLYQIRTGTRIRAAYIGQCKNERCQAFHYGIRVERG